jgi:DNA-binding NtrC family response regulator
LARILIIDDDAAFREGLAETLQDLGHRVLEAGDAARGLSLIREGSADLVFLDYRMPGRDGIDLLRELNAGNTVLPVIMLTAFASSRNTIEAMKLGAFDHLTKPVGRADVEAVLARALRQPAARDFALTQSQGEETLVGNSQAMREVQKLIGKAAASDATALIIGETGTGKEMVARALHENSDRARKPLVAVNCAAIPAELLESELFGHVKGAFTGAAIDRAGRFREAEGGTLLLDEIGDMSLAMQAKILRALQEREIMPVGASRSVKVDARVIAATHLDLAQAVHEGKFREDLYYRLNVVPIHLPPLRERLADVILLAEHFMRTAGDPPKALSSAAARRLLGYAWPGNVRELKNAMQRASVLTRSGVIEVEDLAFLADTGDPASAEDFLQGDLPSAVARLEQALIRKALHEAGGNRAEAARRLGIHRQLLYAKMKDYDIEA